MTSGFGATALAATASVGAGVVLALITVVGGVSAITPTPNSAAVSSEVVRYDAP